MSTFIRQIDNVNLSDCGEYFLVLSEFIKPKFISILKDYPLIGISLELLGLPVNNNWRDAAFPEIHSDSEETLIVPSKNYFIDPNIT